MLLLLWPGFLVASCNLQAVRTIFLLPFFLFRSQMIISTMSAVTPAIDTAAFLQFPAIISLFFDLKLLTRVDPEIFIYLFILYKGKRQQAISWKMPSDNSICMLTDGFTLGFRITKFVWGRKRTDKR